MRFRCLMAGWIVILCSSDVLAKTNEIVLGEYEKSELLQERSIVDDLILGERSIDLLNLDQKQKRLEALKGKKKSLEEKIIQLENLLEPLREKVGAKCNDFRSCFLEWKKAVGLPGGVDSDRPLDIVQYYLNYRCENFYRTLHSKSEISISIYFSYLNDPGKDIDYGPRHKKALAAEMKRPCSINESDDKSEAGFCGFFSDRSEPDTLYKRIYFLNQEILFRINLVSVTSEFISDPETRLDLLDDMGDLWRERAKESLRNDSVVIFYGHARKGAGPDPYYPSSAQLFWHYISNQGVDLLETPFLSNERSQIRAFLTCDSEKYFKGAVKKDDSTIFLASVEGSLSRPYANHLIRSLVGGLTLGRCPEKIADDIKEGFGDVYHFDPVPVPRVLE